MTDTVNIQTNIVILALVALVAIVGIVALVYAPDVATKTVLVDDLQSAGQQDDLENIAGQAGHLPKGFKIDVE